MHRTWREDGLGKTHKEARRVLEACKGEAVTHLRMGERRNILEMVQASISGVLILLPL